MRGRRGGGGGGQAEVSQYQKSPNTLHVLRASPGVKAWALVRQRRDIFTQSCPLDVEEAHLAQTPLCPLAGL